ncbi:hypothetical protein Nepgr_030461 [Nepenthes gracilis]|uniref:Uncharacterized protein n=1 Tax=Nepenthes gracilis TaxID=150966 RepID=A0AAD3Y483_NEPGR|nr:hypothetical protein Nepgr_030461 [Nepenthes gracilis]
MITVVQLKTQGAAVVQHTVCCTLVDMYSCVGRAANGMTFAPLVEFQPHRFVIDFGVFLILDLRVTIYQLLHWYPCEASARVRCEGGLGSSLGAMVDCPQ